VRRPLLHSGFTLAMSYLPNLLTVLRLVLVPFILAAILTGRYFPALVLFGAAALTDILDGAAARRWGSITAAGAYLDPIADKILLSGVFLALAAAHFVPWWLVALIFGRDVLILGGVGLIMALTAERRFAPSGWGKASTFIQIATVSLALWRSVEPNPAVNALAFAMLWPCAAMTAASGLDYTWRAVRILRKR
jgi:cardiolipin synthase (CMP-forming)